MLLNAVYCKNMTCGMGPWQSAAGHCRELTRCIHCTCLLTSADVCQQCAHTLLMVTTVQLPWILYIWIQAFSSTRRGCMGVTGSEPGPVYQGTEPWFLCTSSIVHRFPWQSGVHSGLGHGSSECIKNNLPIKMKTWRIPPTGLWKLVAYANVGTCLEKRT